MRKIGRGPAKRDYTGNVNEASVTASGLAINRVLLPADERTCI